MSNFVSPLSENFAVADLPTASHDILTPDVAPCHQNKPALFFACRQIYKEASPIFYSQNKLIFLDPVFGSSSGNSGSAIEICLRFLASCPAPAPAKIRSLSIYDQNTSIEMAASTECLLTIWSPLCRIISKWMKLDHLSIAIPGHIRQSHELTCLPAELQWIKDLQSISSLRNFTVWLTDDDYGDLDLIMPLLAYTTRDGWTGTFARIIAAHGSDAEGCRCSSDHVTRGISSSVEAFTRSITFLDWFSVHGGPSQVNWECEEVGRRETWYYPTRQLSSMVSIMGVACCMVRTDCQYKAWRRWGR